MNKKNGLLPGWPPFDEFKREIVDLMEITISENIKTDLNTVKNSLIDHINKTEGNFKTVEGNFKTVKEYLTNHITDTNKKITKLENRFNSFENKLDNLLKK